MNDLLSNLNTKDTHGNIELIKHLKNLFVGRPDVIAKRWENEKGSGYSPICKNEWKQSICKKKIQKGSCNTCENTDYVPIDHDLIKRHIDGEIILGTYPIHQDETVTSAAVDLDNHQGDTNPLVDASKFYAACNKHGFPSYVLRSRSGSGYHAYLFFESPLKARDARALVLELLNDAGINTGDLQENSFDRIFPNQPRLTGKKLGNLIAMPFQGKAMKQDHTILLDPDSGFREPYDDQLNALSNVKKISDQAATVFIRNIKHVDNAPENTEKDPTNAMPDGSKAEFDDIRENCGFIDHCVKDSKTLSEQEWYAALTIVSRCQNGSEHAHAISKDYSNYTTNETDEKIKHARNDTKPYTCKYIATSINGNYCKECKLKEIINSPITIGTKAFKDKWDVTPLDIFGDIDIFGEPEWPENACPPVIDEFARDEAARLGVCPSMIAMAALTVAAACIPDDFTVQPKVHDNEWKESARVWDLLVAEPGHKKTPSQNKAMSPLKTIEAEFHEINRELLLQHEKECSDYARWEKDKRRIGDREKPEKPPLKRKMTVDTTIEALSEILKDNPEGILVHFDEMTRFIASMDCYRSGKTGKDRADYMELNNGGTRIIDRVKRGNVYVPNWSAGILGSIQPGPAKREFAAITDDGLLQRFDVHFGRLIGDGEDRVPDYKKIASYHQLIRNLCLRNEFDLSIPSKPYMLSEEAQHQRKIVMNTVKRVMVLPSTSGAFRAALEKWDGRFARYASTFHVTEAVSKKNQPAPLISGETAKRVGRLMILFLLPNAARFYNEILPANRHMVPARWAAGYILARGSTDITERELYRASRELRNFPDTLRQVMNILNASGWVIPTKFHKDGRPSRWAVNPKCHMLYAERAEMEKRRREETIAKIQEASQFLGLTKGKDIDE